MLVGLDTGYFAHCLTGAAALPEASSSMSSTSRTSAKFPEIALSGVDAIVHLAAISNDPMGKSFEDVTYDVNHRASVASGAKSQDAPE